MNALDKLRKQFADSIGYKGKFDSREFEIEFLSWLKLRLTMLGDYEFLLEELDIDFQGSNTAEIGKSSYDSIALPFDTRIITPYFDKLINYSDGYYIKERLIPGNLVVRNGVPFVESSFDRNMTAFVSTYDINTFMTQNPYEGIDYNWQSLHNSRLYNVIVGVYGNTYDKDYSNKLNSLRKFKDGYIDDDYMEMYYNLGDKYFYVVSSIPNSYNDFYSGVKKRA